LARVAGSDGDALADAVAKHITNQNLLHKARIHPVQAIIAYFTYKRGCGDKGSLSWNPVNKIVDALDKAFYLSFNSIKPTGKRVLHAIDCSGSMANAIPSCPMISSAQAVAVMSMMFARAEANATQDDVKGTHDFVLFTAKQNNFNRISGLYPVNITSSMTLEEVSKVVQRSDFGTTDCGLPITNALSTKSQYDAFIVYTDNETYAGNVHPSVAIKEYRKKMGIPAKMAVVATFASANTISDPSDAGMMDISGFDTAGPQLVSDFIRGQAAPSAVDDSVDDSEI